jgi:hypothetical protein
MKPWGNKPHTAPAPSANTDLAIGSTVCLYGRWKVKHPLPGTINSQGLSSCKKEVLQLGKKQYLVRNYNVHNYLKDWRYSINGNRPVGFKYTYIQIQWQLRTYSGLYWVVTVWRWSEGPEVRKGFSDTVQHTYNVKLKLMLYSRNVPQCPSVTFSNGVLLKSTLTLKMEETCSSETFVWMCSTRRCKPEYYNRNSNRYENLVTYIRYLYVNRSACLIIKRGMDISTLWPFLCAKMKRYEIRNRPM